MRESASLHPAGQDEEDHAEPAEDGRGHEPAADRKMEISAAMVHALGPAEEKTEQRDRKKDDAEGNRGLATGLVRRGIGRSHGGDANW